MTIDPNEEINENSVVIHSNLNLLFTGARILQEVMYFTILQDLI